MRIRAALCALPATLLLATSAAAAGVSIHATPLTVQRGHRVHLFGKIPDCGGPLTLLSRAFIHTHDFAGLPAIYATLSSSGSFSVHPKIPATKAPAHYSVTGRCGGGNVGVSVTLKVTS